MKTHLSPNEKSHFMVYGKAGYCKSRDGWRMIGRNWSLASAMLLDKYQFVLDIFSLFNDISDLFFPLYVIVLGVAVGYLLWTALFTEPDSTPAAKVYGFKSKTELLQWKKSFVGSWEVVTRNGFCEVGALSRIPSNFLSLFFVVDEVQWSAG
jgi:hypothetical protein